MTVARLIVLTHRYAGIPMSLVFVAWFLSGIVMIYTRGMPELSAAEARGFQAPINLASVAIEPGTAAAGIDLYPERLVLRSLFNRPAYEFRDEFGRSEIVFADTGERFAGVGWETAAWLVAESLGASVEQVRYSGTLSEADQWTLTERRHLPMHRFEVDNAEQSTVYVSADTAEIVLVLGSFDKLLGWIGAIPHWFYFTSLRIDQPLWYWTVVWVSVIGCIVALFGIILTFTTFRRSKPFRFSESIRYRGWMRWHYYFGAIFGIFILTWTFSGLLSMDPFPWMNRGGVYIDRHALSGGPLDPGDLRLAGNEQLQTAIGDDARQVEFSRIFDRSYATITTSAARVPAIVDVTKRSSRSGDFSTEEIVARLQSGADANVAAATMIYVYDDYYYDRDGTLPLPALRVEFDDPAESRVYVNPRNSAIVRRSDRYTRVRRWLFNGLHSLDFRFWYDKRPLWDSVVILLSIGGLVSSLIGFGLGLKRVGRWMALSAPVRKGGSDE